MGEEKEELKCYMSKFLTPIMSFLASCWVFLNIQVEVSVMVSLPCVLLSRGELIEKNKKRSKFE